MSVYWCVPRRRPLWHRLRVEICADGTGSITAVDDVGDCTGFVAAAGRWLIQNALDEYLDGTYVDEFEPPPPLSPDDAIGAVDPRACHECGWVDAVSRESDAEYEQRIAHGFPGYYFSTHWRVVCDEFRSGRCEQCSRTDRDTRLHHKNCRSFGRERREDVVELCDPCHAREEGRGLWKYRKAA